MFRRACHALSPSDEMFSSNKSDLLLEFKNGSKIYYKSGEVFENLRSETLNGVVIDEVRNQKPELWPLVIRPMLTTTGGWAVFISTPNGFDHFYDLYNYAENNTEHWAAFAAPSTCNPLISNEELDDAKRNMSEAQFAQEYLAEFRDLTSGKTYINFHAANMKEDSPFNKGHDIHHALPIIVCMDFNLSPMAWTLGQKKIDSFHFFDEIFLTNSHTQEAAEHLAHKLIEYGTKPGVILIGDATGKAGQRAAAGQSDYDIIGQTLDRYGISWINQTPESNPSVKDRVNNLNAKLKSASGEVKLTLNPKKCPNLKRDFDRVVWKSSNSDKVVLDQVSNPLLTHASDGVGYAVWALSPINSNVKIPAMRIVSR